jgi:hypothetical protein
LREHYYDEEQNFKLVVVKSKKAKAADDTTTAQIKTNLPKQCVAVDCSACAVTMWAASVAAGATKEKIK